MIDGDFGEVIFLILKVITALHFFILFVSRTALPYLKKRWRSLKDSHQRVAGRKRGRHRKR
jgi:hypothetical protein